MNLPWFLMELNPAGLLCIATGDSHVTTLACFPETDIVVTILGFFYVVTPLLVPATGLGIELLTKTVFEFEFSPLNPSP